jgi:hypothetical protein
MSKQVQGVTQIRDMAILKSTLTEMGISFKELNAETVAWGQGYDKVSVNVGTGKVSYDEMRKANIDQLEQTYGKNFILAEIAKKGHRVESVTNVGRNIEIIASY